MKHKNFHRPVLGVWLAAAVALMAAGSLRAQNTPPPPKTAGEGGAAPGATGAAPEDPAGLDPLSPDQLKQYDLDHYEKIREKSPFSFKIVKQEGPPPISFAADLTLAGFTIDAGKDVTFASLVDKKQNLRFVINSQTPNKDGIQLVKLNRGQTLLESTVLARKGVEEATIAADKQIVERKAVGGNPAAGAQVAQAGRAPGQPNPGGNVPGGNRNNVQGQINQQLRPPGAPAQGNPAGGNAPAAAGALPPGVTPQPVPTTASGVPMSAGDQAAAAAGILPQAQPGLPGANAGNSQQNNQRPARRRVILPPPGGN